MAHCLEKPVTKQQLRALFVKEHTPWNYEEISEDEAQKLFNTLYASSVRNRQKRKPPKFY